MKPWTSITSLALCVTLLHIASAAEIKNRVERSPFPVFELVRFPNDPCGGTGTKNGTCYTKEECESRNGESMGTCAQGYGVCCIFTNNECGKTVAENCTYFENPSTIEANSECKLTVCPCNNNICRLRLDFDMFSIAQPSADQTLVAKAVAGQAIAAAGAGTVGKDVMARGQCQQDTFSVSGGTGSTPVICGMNSDQHMYVDASDACNDLMFQFGEDTTRQWSIKITQYSCDFENLPPEGCTQWFFGPEATGTIRTFNFEGDQHLANQRQKACIRRENNNCRVCYSVAIPNDFQLSGDATKTSDLTLGQSCCNYGTDGAKSVWAYDCFVLPGAMKDATSNLVVADQFCGRTNTFNLLNVAGDFGKKICSQMTPFEITFLSDNWEFGGEGAQANAGARLTYEQDSDNCLNE